MVDISKLVEDLSLEEKIKFYENKKDSKIVKQLRLKLLDVILKGTPEDYNHNRPFSDIDTANKIIEDYNLEDKTPLVKVVMLGQGRSSYFLSWSDEENKLRKINTYASQLKKENMLQYLPKAFAAEDLDRLIEGLNTTELNDETKNDFVNATLSSEVLMQKAPSNEVDSYKEILKEVTIDKFTKLIMEGDFTTYNKTAKLLTDIGYKKIQLDIQIISSIISYGNLPKKIRKFYDMIKMKSKRNDEELTISNGMIIDDITSNVISTTHMGTYTTFKDVIKFPKEQVDKLLKKELRQRMFGSNYKVEDAREFIKDFMTVKSAREVLKKHITFNAGVAYANSLQAYEFFREVGYTNQETRKEGFNKVMVEELVRIVRDAYINFFYIGPRPKDEPELLDKIIREEKITKIQLKENIKQTSVNEITSSYKDETHGMFKIELLIKTFNFSLDKGYMDENYLNSEILPAMIDIGLFEHPKQASFLIDNLTHIKKNELIKDFVAESMGSYKVNQMNIDSRHRKEYIPFDKRIDKLKEIIEHASDEYLLSEKQIEIMKNNTFKTYIDNVITKKFHNNTNELEQSYSEIKDNLTFFGWNQEKLDQHIETFIDTSPISSNINSVYEAYKILLPNADKTRELKAIYDVKQEVLVN